MEEKKKSAPLTIVDYRAGNLTSVKLAFAALGVEALVTNRPDEIRAAKRLVFPGVGAALSAMDNLKGMGLVESIREFAMSGRPFLGICLGMQILFDHSDEDGGVNTLGILPGNVRRFSDGADKVPAIGWNGVDCDGDDSMAQAIRGKEFYFVHSYYAELGDATFGRSQYAGVTFTSMVRRGALVACQFHPEKSGRAGLNLLKEWLSC